jgi:hypothetical protein
MCEGADMTRAVYTVSDDEVDNRQVVDIVEVGHHDSHHNRLVVLVGNCHVHAI